MGSAEGPPALHVVLLEPEIPNNTGTIGRTCVAVGARLHLIRPLGFDISEKACRRAGLDYWPRLDLAVHDSWEAYLSATGGAGGAGGTDRAGARRWLFTTKTDRPIFRAVLRPGDHLVFGKETAGLPETLLRRHRHDLVTLPMRPDERSLNLANAVCAGVYEGVRQFLASGALGLDALGRLARA